MEKILSGLAALLLLFCAGISTPVRGSELETLNNEVDTLYRQGHYDRAVVVAKKALQVTEQAVGPDHPDVVMSLENMAALYRNTGRKNDAEALEKRATAIRIPALKLDI